MIARRYVEFTLRNVAAGTARGPAQYLRIRYEDLCRDAEATLRVVCSFLGEEYDPRMVLEPSRRKATVPAAAAPPWQRRALGTVASRDHGDRRERLGAVDRARVAAVVAPLCAPYGYRCPRELNRLAGNVLNMILTPAEQAVASRAAAKARRSVRTPEARYAAIRRFQEEQAGRIADAWPVVVKETPP